MNLAFGPEFRPNHLLVDPKNRCALLCRFWSADLAVTARPRLLLGGIINSYPDARSAFAGAPGASTIRRPLASMRSTLKPRSSIIAHAASASWPGVVR